MVEAGRMEPDEATDTSTFGTTCCGTSRATASLRNCNERTSNEAAVGLSIENLGDTPNLVYGRRLFALFVIVLDKEKLCPSG